VLAPARIAKKLDVDSRGDHRLAMSAAVLAVLGGSVLHLPGADCVAKSFPDFWRELTKVGVALASP